jgi:ubiquinone/menaquinone biosynthesis C-methylase UbiE/uncharacterized protein YbaR (Trm112 family)
MKHRLMDALVCPKCRENLQLTVFTSENEEVADGLISDVKCSNFCNYKKCNPISVSVSDCNECFKEEIIDGLLVCGCEQKYPVYQKLPRLLLDSFDTNHTFRLRYHEKLVEVLQDYKDESKSDVKEKTADFKRTEQSFSIQWQQFEYEDRTWGLEVQDRVDHFLHEFQLSAEELRGKKVLDGGCGNGKFTCAVSTFGQEMFGMDQSTSPIRAIENKYTFAGKQSPFVHFVQANVFFPPFRYEYFDHIYSSGVLHHTPDTYKAFKSLIITLKKGGKYYILLYKRRSPVIEIPLGVIRTVTTRLSPENLYRLLYGFVTIFLVIRKVIWLIRGKWVKSNLTRREDAVILFDTFAPKYRYTHTIEEVMGWYKELNFTDIKAIDLKIKPEIGVAVLGIKQ